jgi:hypothetical protein
MNKSGFVHTLPNGRLKAAGFTQTPLRKNRTARFFLLPYFSLSSTSPLSINLEGDWFPASGWTRHARCRVGRFGWLLGGCSRHRVRLLRCKDAPSSWLLRNVGSGRFQRARIAWCKKWAVWRNRQRRKGTQVLTMQQTKQGSGATCLSMCRQAIIVPCMQPAWPGAAGLRVGLAQLWLCCASFSCSCAGEADLLVKLN